MRIAERDCAGEQRVVNKACVQGTRVKVVSGHFCIGFDAEGRCQGCMSEAGVVTGNRNPECVEFFV